LIENYVKERESYDFRKGNMNELNNKLEFIRNNSSSKEYRNFKKYFNRSNPQSPVRFFGKNAYSEVDIISVSFIKEQNQNLVKLAQDFLYINLAKEAIIDYKIKTYFNNKPSSLRRRVKISFSFPGISDKSGALKKELDFSVNNFAYLKTK
jgi:type IV secretory pathway component VirB8